jgi:hypothetical protein
MAITKNSQIDLNGNEMILDADGDTTITADTDDQIDIKVAGTDTVVISGGAMALKGATPTLTIGDGGEEDTKIVFDGNTVDYYIGLDDSQDDLVIGKGTTLGTDPAIQVNADERVGLGGAPVTQLHVMGGNGVIFDNPNNGYSGLKITDDTSGDYNINFLAGRSQGSTKFKFFRYGRDQNTTPWSDYSSPVEVGHISGGQTAFTGKVGAGTLVPDKALTVADNGSDCSIMIYKSPDGSLNSDQKVIAMGTGSSANNSGTSGGTEHGIMQMFHNGTEEIRLYTQGDSWIKSDLAVGDTTSNRKFHVHGITRLEVSTAVNYPILEFFNTNGEVGRVRTSGVATAYDTSSDYRLKENVSYDWDATTRLKQLKPARFNFIADADTTFDGFLVHEVSSIVPEAIGGEKDEVDDDGNPVYQGIDQSKLVPLLVKTIQELEARITTLEGE